MPEGKKKETQEEITPTISCNALAGIYYTSNSKYRRIYQGENGDSVD